VRMDLMIMRLLNCNVIMHGFGHVSWRLGVLDEKVFVTWQAFIIQWIRNRGALQDTTVTSQKLCSKISL
jgi:hypothetical protein